MLMEDQVDWVAYLLEIAGDLQDLSVCEQVFLKDVNVAGEDLLGAVSLLQGERTVQTALAPAPNMAKRNLLESKTLVKQEKCV